MPQTGHEDTEYRRNLTRLIKRKFGDPDVRLLTVGEVDFYANWEHRLHSLPQLNLPSPQDENGNLPRLPGMDGPLE